ncbi:hypothetical protein SAMN04488072_10464 [Lentibacillus halodurans]|uniref:Uncharacterized protein n=1 Tax=Lentibacillus halodurans TaxID=237679 RepID=A0A1I0X0S9_9BACI|nr:hypothetical protein SAMN04488072_10464 [Lentibacillus halodurans]
MITLMERGAVKMPNKNNQFKENKNHGEHRNGRKSQYKNNSTHGGGRPDEYISQKDDS